MTPQNPPPDNREGREYLLDMLSQLAQVAANCGETGISLALNLMVKKRLDQLEEASRELSRFGSDKNH